MAVLNLYLDWVLDRQEKSLELVCEILGDREASASEMAIARECLELLWLAAAELWARNRCGAGLARLRERIGHPPKELEPALERILSRPRPPGPIPKPGCDPESVVFLVRELSLYGVPFRGGEGSENPAMVAAGAVLGVHPEYAKRLYNRVPKNRREEIRADMLEVYGGLLADQESGELILSDWIDRYGWIFQYARSVAVD